MFLSNPSLKDNINFDEKKDEEFIEGA